MIKNLLNVVAFLAVFLVFFPLFLVCGYCGETTPEFQMLMSPEKQKELGFERQRRMYSQKEAEQLSLNASRKGFQILLREKKNAPAQDEFNRAWRFNPDNHEAWWGSGLVRWELAKHESAPGEDVKGLRDSIVLLEKAEKLAPVKEKMNVQSDLLQVYSIYGALLLHKGDAETGRIFLEKGERIAVTLTKDFPDCGRFYFSAAINAFYRKDFRQALVWINDAERCRFSVDEGFRMAVTNAISTSAK